MARRCWTTRDVLSQLIRTLVLLVAAAAAVTGVGSAAEPAAKAIDAAVLLQFPSHPHSGFSVAIAHGGRIVYEKGYGYRDDGTPDRYIPKDEDYYGMSVARLRAPRVAADAQTIYEIGSVTKQFTAAAIFLLSEQGKLAIDDPVSRYAPEFTELA